MTSWAIVPVKPGGERKTRLAAVLSAEDRARLVEAMTARVVTAIADVRGIDRVHVLGSPDHGDAPDVRRLADPGGGLNAALADALAAMPAASPPARILVVAADLPGLSPADVAALLEVPEGALGIAPDRHGRGTNALSLPWPAARGFGFAYGEDSCAAHVAAAGALGIPVTMVEREGLARDVDWPDDLADARHLMHPAG